MYIVTYLPKLAKKVFSMFCVNFFTILKRALFNIVEKLYIEHSKYFFIIFKTFNNIRFKIILIAGTKFKNNQNLRFSFFWPITCIVR